MLRNDKSDKLIHPGATGAPARARSCLTPLLGLCLLLSGMASHAQGNDPREQTALERQLAGEMVSIPAGSFYMGDLSHGWESEMDEQPVRRDTPRHSAGLTLAVWSYNKVLTPLPDNVPVRRVTVPAFRLGKYEVTVSQFRAFVESTGYHTDTGQNTGRNAGCWSRQSDGDWGWAAGRSWRNPGYSVTDEQPVACVSWNDTQAFVDWLNEKTGGNYRLPTEAEWEYAARAGTTTRYSWGNDIGRNRANCDNDDCGDSWDYTAPIGSFPANPWGLHDMHGNVFEWVEDCWNYDYDGAPTDGSAWTSGECSWRVIRGGSWYYSAWNLRSAHRGGLDRTGRLGLVGFRLAQDE